MIRKPCWSRFSLHKFVHLKFFWTQFKNVHLRGPCSSRPCISRPYCIYRKVASSRLSRLVAHFHIFHCLCTFGHNGPKLNTLLIAEILSGKNVLAWVSMDFTQDKFTAPIAIKESKSWEPLGSY